MSMQISPGIKAMSAKNMFHRFKKLNTLSSKGIPSVSKILI